MSKTLLETTPEERRTYRMRAVVEARYSRRDRSAENRWREVQRVTREAADLLRRKFGARRVVVFGSAGRRETFTDWSDIDLAVWGVAPEVFHAAVAAVTRLSETIGIDVVDGSRCSEAALTFIEQDGKEL
ncbi:MAG: nucleotidyltransferase family protein [Opitutaceae bacterium]